MRKLSVAWLGNLRCTHEMAAATAERAEPSTKLFSCHVSSCNSLAARRSLVWLGSGSDGTMQTGTDMDAKQGSSSLHSVCSTCDA